MGIIDDALDMKSGYVLNFSDNTMARFFDEELGVTIYQDKYAFNGTSKAQNSICRQKLANFLGIETFARETNRFIFQFEGAKNY